MDLYVIRIENGKEGVDEISGFVSMDTKIVNNELDLSYISHYQMKSEKNSASYVYTKVFREAACKSCDMIQLAINKTSSDTLKVSVEQFSFSDSQVAGIVKNNRDQLGIKEPGFEEF